MISNAHQLGSAATRQYRQSVLPVTASLLLTLLFLQNWQAYSKPSQQQAVLSSGSLTNTQEIATIGVPPLISNHWYAWQINKADTNSQNDEILLPPLAPGKYLLVVGVLGEADIKYPVEITWGLLCENKLQKIGEWHRLSNRRFSSSAILTESPARNDPLKYVRVTDRENVNLPARLVCFNDQNQQQDLLKYASKTKQKLTSHYSSEKINSEMTFTGLPGIVIKAEKIKCENGLNIWLDHAIPVSDRYENLSLLLARSFNDRVARWYQKNLPEQTPRTIQLVITPYLKKFGTQAEPLKMCVAVKQQSNGRSYLNNSSNTIFVNAQLDQLLSEQNNPQESVATLLAHELFHLCSLNAMQQSNEMEIYEWIFEGWAHAAERECTGSDSNLLNRLNAFAMYPQRSPLRVRNSTSQGFYRDTGIRGASASFLSYLCKMYPEITWQQRLNNALTPTGIEQLHRKTVPDLFRDWTCYEAKNKLQIQKKKGTTLNVHLPGTKTHFHLRGTTAKTLLLELPTKANQSHVHQSFQIHTAHKSQLQISIMKIE